jgi:hypothetical protein
MNRARRLFAEIASDFSQEGHATRANSTSSTTRLAQSSHVADRCARLGLMMSPARTLSNLWRGTGTGHDFGGQTPHYRMSHTQLHRLPAEASGGVVIVIRFHQCRFHGYRSRHRTPSGVKIQKHRTVNNAGAPRTCSRTAPRTTRGKSGRADWGGAVHPADDRRVRPATLAPSSDGSSIMKARCGAACIGVTDAPKRRR